MLLLTLHFKISADIYGDCPCGVLQQFEDTYSLQLALLNLVIVVVSQVSF